MQLIMELLHAVTPLLIASKHAFILGIIPSVIVSFEIISKISDEEISSMSFLFLSNTPSTFVINNSLLDFKDFAMAIAKSLKSRRLLLMTNVDGVLDKNKKLIEEISSSDILEMISNETITEGMIPKINACLDAINNGVTACSNSIINCI